MKTLIAFLLIALAPPAFADDPDDLDPGAKAVFESVQSAWSSGGHEKIGTHFDKDSKVSLSLDDVYVEGNELVIVMIFDGERSETRTPLDDLEVARLRRLGFGVVRKA